MFTPAHLGCARRYADIAVQAERYNPNALVNKGNCHFARGELDTALSLYEEALSIESGCTEALCVRPSFTPPSPLLHAATALLPPANPMPLVRTHLLISLPYRKEAPRSAASGRRHPLRLCCHHAVPATLTLRPVATVTLAAASAVLASPCSYNVGLVHKRLGQLEAALDAFLQLHDTLRNSAEVMLQVCEREDMAQNGMRRGRGVGNGGSIGCEMFCN